MATYAIFETIVVFGEVITVSDDHSPAPHIHLPTHSQIAVLIELLMDSSCLQDRQRRKERRMRQEKDHTCGSVEFLFI